MKLQVNPTRGSGKDKLRSALLLGLSLYLTACAVPIATFFDDSGGGRDLARGESATLHFFTNDPNLDTGVRLNAGTRYAVDVVILSNWTDSYIEENETGETLDETGFANSVMPFEWLGFTRRSRQNRWFELMLYQPDCGRESLRGVTELDVDETNGSYQFIASCDGKLSMFVNDSPGFYGNNAGYANINLSRVN